MTIEAIVQGLIFFIPLIVVSLIAFWRQNPVLFLISAGIAMMMGLKSPDILTGDTTTNLSMSVGLVIVAYAFLCLAFGYVTLLRMGRG
jgi:hypothetical protein